jgi:hypothetical protein
MKASVVHVESRGKVLLEIVNTIVINSRGEAYNNFQNTTVGVIQSCVENCTISLISLLALSVTFQVKVPETELLRGIRQQTAEHWVTIKSFVKDGLEKMAEKTIDAKPYLGRHPKTMLAFLSINALTEQLPINARSRECGRSPSPDSTLPSIVNSQNDGLGGSFCSKGRKNLACLTAQLDKTIFPCQLLKGFIANQQPMRPTISS